ncbi:hypothetical protein [Kineococcus rubinsiae]|nr:hypothetical protein [Kineococcus rubinsiae]
MPIASTSASLLATSTVQLLGTLGQTPRPLSPHADDVAADDSAESDD